MSLAKRLLMASSALGGRRGAGQVEFTEIGTHYFMVPEGVTMLSGVAISAGEWGMAISPFHGGKGGNLHWRNAIPVTPGEVLTVQVGRGLRGSNTPLLATWLRRGASEYLLRTAAGTTLYHPTLGGGGGEGGARGSGADGNGGAGGGGPGYTGRGGRGGNYLDTTNGGPPDPLSGGGRGGDRNGIPYGWASVSGEGTGLLGLSADKSTSLGPKNFGGGGWTNTPGGQDGGLRLMWGGGRSYPDDAPDEPSQVSAPFVTSSNGTATPPYAVAVHGNGAKPGDIAIISTRIYGGSGSFSGITGGAGNWTTLSGVGVYKQLTQEDLDASAGGTLRVTGTGNHAWGCTVYHLPVKADVKTSAGASTDTVTVPGFTKRTDCKRVVLVATDADTGAIAVPAGFTARVSRTTPVRMLIADAAPADYADGATVTLTGMGATNATFASLTELY